MASKPGQRLMKTVLTTLLAAVLLVIAGGLAFMYSGVYDVSAKAPHGAATNWILETTMHASVERRARQIEAPELDERSLLLAGINDFEAMCVQCHGAPGRKPDALGQGLNPEAPDLVEAAREMSAEELFWITKNGIRMTGMPAWGATHEDDALWPIVALVTALPELDARAYAALLQQAEGHHAGDASATDHPHAEDHEPGTRDDEEAADAGESGEEDHDHSSHEH
jgi:mono/diheme cytochrome c family protein